MLYPNEPYIDASNYMDHFGGACGTLPRVDPVGSIACAPATPFKLKAREEWADCISKMEAEKSRTSDLMVEAGIPVVSQEFTLLCWAYSCAAAVMVVRAQQGQPFVKLSPESIAGPVNGYRNAGNYLSRALKQVVEVGIASEEFVPHLTIEKSGFKPGWEQDAAKYRAKEFWDLGANDGQMFDRLMTMCCDRFVCPVNLPWWGHSVLAVDPFMQGSGRNLRFGCRIWNSHGDGFKVIDEPYMQAAEAYVLRSIKLS